MVKETAWKRQELKTEIEEKRTGSKAAQESDFLDLLKKKGKT